MTNVIRQTSRVAVYFDSIRWKRWAYCSYDCKIDINLTHLEELARRAEYINTTFNIDNIQIIQIVDREADSVAFARELVDCDSLFVLRGKGNSKVQYTDKITNTTIDIKQSNLADKLPYSKC